MLAGKGTVALEAVGGPAVVMVLLKSAMDAVLAKDAAYVGVAQQLVKSARDKADVKTLADYEVKAHLGSGALV